MLLAICCALLSLSIVGGEPGSPGQPPTPIKLRPIAKGGFTAMRDAKQEVVKEATRWKAIWLEHAGKSTVPLPEVDFSKELVIVTAMGQRPTGGYSIQIAKVETAAGKVKVYVQRKSPAKGSMTIQVLTAPFEFVAIPKTDLPVEFLEMDKPGTR